MCVDEKSYKFCVNGKLQCVQSSSFNAFPTRTRRCSGRGPDVVRRGRILLEHCQHLRDRQNPSKRLRQRLRQMFVRQIVHMHQQDHICTLCQRRGLNNFHELFDWRHVQSRKSWALRQNLYSQLSCRVCKPINIICLAGFHVWFYLQHQIEATCSNTETTTVPPPATTPDLGKLDKLCRDGYKNETKNPFYVPYGTDCRR